MLRALKNRLIGAGLDAWWWSLRVKHVVLGIGRPRLAYLDHVTIPVDDLEVARRFYCDVLGATYMMTVDDDALRRFGRPPAENGGDGVYHVSLCLGGATRIDLFQQSTGQPPPLRGHPHLAFRVPPGDMATWKARLEAKGIPTEGPLQLGPPGQASLYFNDPSGNHLEIVCLGLSASIPLRPPEMARLVWSPHAPAATR